MRLKEKARRVYCRCRTFASVTIEDLRKGKLKGHLVEVIVILTLFITLAFVFFRPDTSTRKISFYFKDIQIEAKYHREQILKIQKEKESLNHLEQFHSTAYGKILSEFEDALSKDISHGIPKQVLLQEICRDNLHDVSEHFTERISTTPTQHTPSCCGGYHDTNLCSSTCSSTSSNATSSSTKQQHQFMNSSASRAVLCERGLPL